MIAYKGFHGDLTCTCGHGTFQYEVGKTVYEERSKCKRFGTHCAEYPLECLRWYPLGRGNRYFMVEAAGSIDELGQDDTQLACTELTLKKELTIKELAGYSMMYIVGHPLRAWKKSGRMLDVAEDSAKGQGPG